MARKSTYSIVVLADSEAEAQAIGAEGLPRGAEILASEVAREPDEGDDAWRVTFRYQRTAESPPFLN